MTTTECTDCGQGMIMQSSTGRCGSCESDRRERFRRGDVEAVKITCSFCGVTDWPAKLADHWCSGRRAFVATYGKEA